MIEIGIERADRTVTVTVGGDVDIATVRELEKAVDAVVAEEPGELRLELSGVTFLDSSGVALLVGARRELAAGPTAFVLVRPSRQATVALETMQLAKYFRFDPPRG